MKGSLAFLLGVAGGSIVTWLAVKNYYKSIADEEIASVIETFSADQEKVKINSEEDQKALLEKARNKPEISQYNSLVHNYDSVFRSKSNSIDVEAKNNVENSLAEKEHPEDDHEVKNAPYLITIEEYEDDNGFDKHQWTYYSGDDILADEEEEMVTHKEIIGEEHLDMFSRTDCTVIHIRNEMYGADYEILYSPRDWHDMN